MNRRARPILVLVLSVAFFGAALQNAMEQRHRARQLTGELDRLQEKSRALQDERRSLHLEHMTVTDYANLRAAAAGLGMREPRPDDGSLLFLGGEKQ